MTAPARLWDWAARAYGRPGVEGACLRLQDEYGQCVPLLLWRLWTLAEGRPVDEALAAQTAAAARAWDEAAVSPLRLVRRRLATAPPPVPDRVRLALKAELQAVELRAEKVLLDTLEAMTPAPCGAQAEPETALAELSRAWGAPAPDAALAALAAAAA